MLGLWRRLCHRSEPDDLDEPRIVSGRSGVVELVASRYGGQGPRWGFSTVKEFELKSRARRAENLMAMQAALERGGKSASSIKGER
jgi:hypothetical protein